MNIAFCLDYNYVSPLLVLLTSLFANNADETIWLHVVLTDAAPKDQQRISSFVEVNGGRTTFYNLDIERIKSFAWENERYNMTAFYRLLLPEMMPAEVERFIYLDVDTLVIGSLRELYDWDLGDKPVGAVPDPISEGRPDLGLPYEGDYFNSGVLLVNRYVWEKQKISEKTIKFLRQFPEKATYVDQDGLNAVLAHNWMPLPPKYNFVWRYIPMAPRSVLEKLVKEIVIVHYNTSYKPWHRLSSNRLDFLYHRYRKQAPVQEPAYKPLPFTIANFKEVFRLRLTNFYLNNPALQHIWRNLRGR